jgi:hypothetical protein
MVKMPIFIVRLKARSEDEASPNHPHPIHLAWEATCEQCGVELSGDMHGLLGLDLARHYYDCAKPSVTAVTPREEQRHG